MYMININYIFYY